MCGRYALFANPTDLADEFGLVDVHYEPTYNAAPTEELPVILDDAPADLSAARWGLVPSWSDGPGSDPDPINARIETVTENPAFVDAFRNRRCLVPVDGFYEWVATGDGTRPYFFSQADGRPFVLAGLWEMWTPERKQTGLGEFGGSGPSREPEPMRSFTVVTTAPTDFFADYHYRMPVALGGDVADRWLSGEPADRWLSTGNSEAVTGSGAGDRNAGCVDLRGWEVSTAVNDPSNDHPELVDAVG